MSTEFGAKGDREENRPNLQRESLGVKLDSLKKRKPILALILSLLTPGLGQIYNGQFRKGISYFVGFYLVYIVFSFLLLTFYGMILYLIVTMGFFLFIVIDALRGAIKFNTIELKAYNKWYIYLIIFLIGNDKLLDDPWGDFTNPASDTFGPPGGSKRLIFCVRR
jgi:TM2 domain-containing membrane protein YozV